MGVLNVTPDSFSDGGRYLDAERAVAHGLEMARLGADVVDVGGESSRPGAEPVSEREELARVVPVIEALSPHVRVSVDTVKRAVAEAALGAGATLLNDISASLWPVAADCQAGWVAMHMQGAPRTMQDDPRATTTSWPRCTPSCGPGRRRRSRAGCERCGWTRASASARRPRTTWPSCTISPSSWPRVSRCWWGRAARAFSGDWPRAPGPRPAGVPERVGGVHRHRHMGHAGGRVDGPGPRRAEHRAGGDAGRAHPGRDGGRARPGTGDRRAMSARRGRGRAR